MKKLISSYKFWTALAGAVGLFVTAISEFIGITISAEGAKEIIMTFCGILVAIGIVKLPTKKEQTKLEENSENNNAIKEQQQNSQNNRK